MTTNPQVISIRQNGQYGGYHTWGVALYEAVPRKADGIPTWRLSADLEDCHRGLAKAMKARIQWAEKLDLPYLNVNHGQRVDCGF